VGGSQRASRASTAGEVHYTNIACRLLDLETCRCRDYARRHEQVRDCLPLTPAVLARDARWLPPTCAYRLLAEGGRLPSWHPLRTGRAESVVEAGISVLGMAVSEDEAGPPLQHLLDRRWAGEAG
jgi:uncharacterized cysteine cluster protein YcgN (CxxCxxCC family)